MSKTHTLLLWALEPIVLVCLIIYLVRIIRTNYSHMKELTNQMCTTINKAQKFLEHVDNDYEIMNKCGKTIKSLFLNFGKVYKEINKGAKSLEEAFQDARMNVPRELKSSLSGFFPVPCFKSLNADKVGATFDKSPTPDIIPSFQIMVTNMMEGYLDDNKSLSISKERLSDCDDVAGVFPSTELECY